MASAFATDPKDHPRLSLVITSPPSSSPFPSPSSSFLPPPRPGAHEFASVPPSRSLRRKKEDDSGNTATPTTAPVQPQQKRTSEMQLPALEIPSESSSTLSTRDSPTPSRPAPPSPSLSRRTSAALSQRSSSSKDNLSRNPSTKRQSKLQNEIQVISSQTPQKLAPEHKRRRRSLLVKIRDFAFPSSDDRHLGIGPDVPRPNKHQSSYTGGSFDNDDDGDPDFDSEERRDSGWGGFMWSGLTNRLSWSFGGGRAMLEGVDAPSKTDFERNFDMSSPVDEKHNVQLGTGMDEDEDEDDEEYEEEEEGDFLSPGKYRAMYSFEPEGTAEMALEEDQIVNVIGRGGGVGWAVVEKDNGGHALVPESYLELVELNL